MPKFAIAIDGPAGAGKSTVARLVAEKLNYTYIDTGAMYRCIALKALQRGIPLQAADTLTAIAVETEIVLSNSDTGQLVYMDGTNVSDQIRTPEVTGLVAEVAQVEGVRTRLVDLQRQMAAIGGVVMDGRDIGNTVLPNADIKVFLTASVEERAQRRYQELIAKGYIVNLNELCQEIAARDKADSERKLSPLTKATDAIVIDSTSLSIEEVVDRILELCSGEGHQ